VYVVPLAVATVVIALLAAVGSSREPAYGGRALSAWLPMLPTPSVRRESSDPAAEAIRAMGSNSVPYLLKWIRYEKPPWRAAIARAVNSIVGRVRPAGVFATDAKDKARAQRAMYALIILGPKAEGAVGELTKMLYETNNPASTTYAPMTLAAIGKKGLPPLVAVLTNQQTTSLVRCRAMGNIGAMGTNALPCVPDLRQAQESSSWIVRRDATNVLRRIDPETMAKWVEE